MTDNYPITIYDQNNQERISGFAQFPGAPNPAVIRGPFPFVFNTAGLTAGVPIYTPAVGDVITDIWVSIATAFNGTTPKADVGTFSGGNNGLFKVLGPDVIDLTAADAAVTTNAGLVASAGDNLLSAAAISVGSVGTSAVLPWFLRVTVANPLLLVVSQSGAKGGTATGATAGAGNVYVVTATPQSF